MYVDGDLPDIAQQYPDMFSSAPGSDASSGSSFSSRGAGGGARDSSIPDADGKTGCASAGGMFAMNH
jgi:hypothetical protein